MQLFRYLHEKLSTVNQTPEESLLASRHRIALIDALFTDENALYIRNLYAYDHLNLAGALFALGKKEEGYAALSKAVACFEEWFAVSGNERHYVGIFDTIVHPAAKWSTPADILKQFEGDRRHPRFASVEGENRYKALVDRIKKHVE